MTEPERRRSDRAAWLTALRLSLEPAAGVVAGFVGGSIGLLHTVKFVQGVLKMPPMNPVVIYFSGSLRSVPVSYWSSWVIGFVVVVLMPIVVLVKVPRLRSVGIGYGYSAMFVSIFIALIFISTDLGGMVDH